MAVTATQEVASDEMLAMFKTAWDTTSLIAVYENVRGATPTAQAAWARPIIRHDPKGSQSLTGALNKIKYERHGRMVVSIFIPNGNGLSLGRSLGKIVADAFEGKKSDSGVWFRNIRIVEVGPDDEWYMFNVGLDFVYDEIK